MTDGALLRSLSTPNQLARAEELAEVEPSTVTPGGLIATYRVRRRSPCDLMFRRGALTYRQKRAASRLYRSYALGIALARDQEAGGSSRTPAGLTDAQLGAAMDYGASRLAVGPADWPFVTAIVIDEITVREYVALMQGSNSGRVIQYQTERLRRALDRLADCHDGDGTA